MPDRVEHNPIYQPAPQEVVEEAITIPKGTTHFIRHVFNAILDEKPRITIELIWYVRKEDAPFGGTDEWQIEIEGMPCSLKLSLEAMASVVRNQELHDGDPTMSSYYATACVLLQAIPMVCAAQPGFVYATAFTNSVNDFERLATRKTLVT